MTKKPETVKEEDLITRLEDGTIIESREPYTRPSGERYLEERIKPRRIRKPRRRRKKEGLVYKKDSKVPFTGAVESSEPGHHYWLEITINNVAYYKDGERTGLYEMYIEENGYLWTRENIKYEWVYDGLQEYYYENGQLKTSENFKDDVREGQRTTYSRNGSIIFDYTMKDGKEDGIWKYYEEDEKGNAYLHTLDHYKDGETVGPGESYYSNGQLQSKWHTSKDILEGFYVSYYSDGQLRRKADYIYGEEDGLSEDYYENGQLELRETYKEGNLIKSECYDKKGNLTKIETHKNRKLVK